MTGTRESSASVLMAVVVAAFAMAGWSATPVAAGDPMSVTPSADAWVNGVKPGINYGTVATLRAAKSTAESLIRFKVAGWAGLGITSLTLTLDGISGDGSGLIVDEMGADWREGTVTWRSRPAFLREIERTPVVAGASATFDLAGLFPSGAVDRNAISLRVRSSSASLTTFGARESTRKPRLSLVAAAQTSPSGALTPLADTWAGTAAPSSTHGAAKYLVVDGEPKADAYLMFDVAQWRSRKYQRMELQLNVRTPGGAGVSLYRVSAKWSESNLTWKTRPGNLALLGTLSAAPRAGTLTLDVSSAFADQLVSSDRLALRIATTNALGFDFSSREGPTAPRLVVMPVAAATPTATAAPTATPSLPPTPAPTTTPTATVIGTHTASPSDAGPSTCPTATPTASPTATPTQSPTSSPTQSPTPTPTAEPLFYWKGYGTDHGAGLSQWGARGRAQAGQTYDQILAFYYSNVQLQAIDGQRPIRVLLADGFWPTPTKPARVTGLVGDWQSASFPGVIFPEGSYVELWPNFPAPTPTPTVDPTASPTQDPGCGSVDPSPTATTQPSPDSWTATAFDSAGGVLVSVTTTELVVEAVATDGLLSMAFRDSINRYQQYRGKIRLIAASTGIQAINELPLESYLRGVVPVEMPSGWATEALKAQTVAARSYAWVRIKPTRTWDVVPTAANQVYGGFAVERVGSDVAIAATANVVMTYNGNVISAVYHTTAGGHTENSEYVFPNSAGTPGNVVGYLRGKPDVNENGVPYDIASPSYGWHTGQFTMRQFNAIMSANSQTDVGEIYTINYERGVSGRVYRVTLTGSLGTKQVSGGRFKNIFNASKPNGSEIKSAIFYLTPVVP